VKRKCDSHSDPLSSSPDSIPRRWPVKPFRHGECTLWPCKRVPDTGNRFVAFVGIGDTLGNALFAASSHHGLVSVTSVLASLYPIVTVVLARFVLRERVDRSQQLGIAGTLAGVALLSAG